ncbi:MAG: hypothetical protein ACYC55_09110 [Candidatus Geothermincolia bacterium]
MSVRAKLGVGVMLLALLVMLPLAGCTPEQLDSTGNLRKLGVETDRINASTGELVNITAEMDAEEQKMALSLELMARMIEQTEYQIDMTNRLMEPNLEQQAKTGGILAAAQQILAENLTLLAYTQSQCDMTGTTLALIQHLDSALLYFVDINNQMEVKMRQILEAMQ